MPRIGKPEHEIVAVELHVVRNLFRLNIIEETVIHGRSFVFERRRAVADFRPTDDARSVDLRPLHRSDDLLAFRLLLLDGAVRQQPVKPGSGLGVEAGGDGVVH